MISTIVKRAAAFALLTTFGSATAWACDVGNIQCDSAGYRYVCQCYTSSGCQYYAYGSCSAYHEDTPEIMTRRIADVERPADLATRLHRLRLDSTRPMSP